LGVSARGDACRPAQAADPFADFMPPAAGLQAWMKAWMRA
jgi:hypothetical protein